MAESYIFKPMGIDNFPLKFKIKHTILKDEVFNSETGSSKALEIELKNFKNELFLLDFKSYISDVLDESISLISKPVSSADVRVDINCDIAVLWMSHNGNVNNHCIRLDSSGVYNNYFPVSSSENKCVISIYIVDIVFNNDDILGRVLFDKFKYAIQSGYNSHAYGYGTFAIGDHSHAEGSLSVANSQCAHAEGYYTTASGDYSHTEGSSSKANALCSHAEGYNTLVNGEYSHAEGMATKAYNNSSHAEGNSSIASGIGSHAEGYNTTASGDYSHSEGSGCIASSECAHAEGYYTEASGTASHSEGISTKAIGALSHAEGESTQAKDRLAYACGLGTIANNLQYVIGMCNVENASNMNRFIVGNGYTNANSNCFRVHTSEGVFSNGVYHSSGADYAEMFEWEDKNPNNEDRVGRFVTLDGKYIRLANKDDDFILGIVSGNPSILGDVFDDQWKGMHLFDVYGRPILEDIDIYSGKEDREPCIVTANKINPEYDNSKVYIPRSERPEWDAVGMLGKLVVLDDGTCEVNGYVIPSKDGIGTKSNTRTKYRVMERLDENHVLVLIL